MKASLVGQLPAGNEWLYEIKWDGYRALASKRGHSVRLLSLKNKNLSNDFPAVMEAVRGVAADTVLIDGEIVAVDERGCPSFQMLQNRATLGRDWQIVYYAFDLLELQGEDWKARPLTERKERLQQLLFGSEGVTMPSCQARQRRSCAPLGRLGWKVLSRKGAIRFTAQAPGATIGLSLSWSNHRSS
jgi:bifunctional non-homologous end joining protein LigD